MLPLTNKLCILLETTIVHDIDITCRHTMYLALYVISPCVDKTELAMPCDLEATHSHSWLPHQEAAAMWAQRKNLGRIPCSMCRLPYLRARRGENNWVRGSWGTDWEHGACLGSLQASQEQRHVENRAPVL